MRLLMAATLLAFLAVVLAVPASAAQGEGSRQTFIVVLKDSVAEGSLGALLADDRVASIERDAEVTAFETDATWGIDRIDQRALPLSETFTYTNTGSGVKAYIIDTGIRFDHSQFGGRAESGFDAVDGGTADDCNGHGTHVAGTVGGTTYGVAKGVTLVAVRVLSCSGSGTTSGVIAGVDWVTGNHGQSAVANMSLGGGASSSLDTAVRKLDRGRGQLRHRRRQRKPHRQARGRVQEVARSRHGSDDDRRNRPDRQESLVGELRQLRRLVCAGGRHHIGLVHKQHGHEHDQWHVDGDTAHGWSRGALPAVRPGSVACDRTRCPLRQHDEGDRHLVEDDEQPPVVHELLGTRSFQE